VNYEESGGAGLCARRFSWRRFFACASHRQDAGATKNFSEQLMGESQPLTRKTLLKG